MPLPTLLIPGNLKHPKGHDDEAPIDYILSWLKHRMTEFGAQPPKTLADRVLIVRARTAAGKSTTLPVSIFRLLRSETTPSRVPYRGKSVLSAQPRVLTAISIAEDVASKPYNPDIILGKTVGYQTGAIAEKPPTGLIYATIGTLLMQLRVMPADVVMSLYRFIIIDEAHERSLVTDVTLMKLKQFYKRNMGRSELPLLLLTSATIDTDKYARYFEVGDENIVDVKGHSYPTPSHYPAHGTNNYLAEAAATAMRIHRENPDDPPEQSDILIFAPGKAELRQIADNLTKAARGRHADAEPGDRPILILPIDGDAVKFQTREYWQVFENPHRLATGGSPPPRRIVVSTAVAETGLTIDTLKYVIDCGWNRQPESYPPFRLGGVITRPAAKTRVTQRRGRAGRLFPGEFYPLYTENVYNELPDEQLPDIITEGPEEILLDIVLEQQDEKARRAAAGEDVLPEFRVEDIDMLDVPPADSIAAAVELGLLTGVLSDDAVLPRGREDGPERRGYGLTPLGRIAARLSDVTLEEFRVIAAGYTWEVSTQDLITIVAFFRTRRADIFAPASAAAKGATLPAGAAALAEGLPHIFARGATGGALDEIPPTEAEAFYYRFHLLVADEFIEALAVFGAFTKAVVRASGNLHEVAGWCAEHGVDYGGLMAVVRRRDEIIEDFLVAGLDPFWGGKFRFGSASENIRDFLAVVTRIKQCLYEGLRLRILRYDEKENAYRTRHGLLVDVPDPFTDLAASRLRGLGVRNYRKPRVLVTNEHRAQLVGRSPRPFLYSLKAGYVSVLDGFVADDTRFTEPREGVE